jgi:hypothetical protein
MANVATSDVNSLQVLVAGSSNLTKAQIAQSECLLYSLLQLLFGPNTTTTNIPGGALGQ